MERNGIKYINPTQKAQAEWKKNINHLSDISLFPTVKSTHVLSCHHGPSAQPVDS